jgi:hypothetical protein
MSRSTAATLGQSWAAEVMAHVGWIGVDGPSRGSDLKGDKCFPAEIIAASKDVVDEIHNLQSTTCTPTYYEMIGIARP